MKDIRFNSEALVCRPVGTVFRVGYEVFYVPRLAQVPWARPLFSLAFLQPTLHIPKIASLFFWMKLLLQSYKQSQNQKQQENPIKIFGLFLFSTSQRFLRAEFWTMLSKPLVDEVGKFSLSYFSKFEGTKQNEADLDFLEVKLNSGRPIV
jgi:hypothetical protein